MNKFLSFDSLHGRTGFCLLACIVLTISCTAIRSVMVERTAPPEELFTCYMRELARMEYVVEDGNRDAGFIRAFREETGFLRGDYGYEATITIIPSDFGSEVNVTIRDVLIEQGGGRTSDDLGMSQEGLDDLELLRVACV